MRPAQLIPNSKTKNIYTIAKLVAVISIAVAAVITPRGVSAATGGPQICNPSTSCTIGEYVFDDSYVAVNTATCTLTSKYPDGTAHLTLQAMPISAQADGWYSYGFTAPATTGLYRAQVCCLVGADTMCLDKSFEVKSESSSLTTSAIATAVWDYSGRTLSSFGSLATDVWSASTRTLSSFGNLVSDVWNNTTRTLSGTSDVAAVKETVDEIQESLETIVNKPIIENVLEEESDLDLEGRLKETRAIANQVYVNGQYLTSEVGGLISLYQGISSEDILGKLNEIEEILGEKDDTDTKNSMFGSVNWFSGFWGWQEAGTLKTSLTDVSGIISGLKLALSNSGKTASVKTDLTRLVKVLLSFEKGVGKLTDTETSRTLYGNIKKTEQLASTLDGKEADIDTVLAQWKKKEIDLTSTQSKIKTLSTEVLALSLVPKTKTVLGISTSTPNDTKTLKNILLGLKGLIKTNRVLLARGIGKTSSNTWLEEGSIVFKTLATNPSSIISQDVEIKYYLPQEIREEDIISTDSGLEVKYDSEKDQYFVYGTYTLAAGQTKVVSVKTQDIWVISETEVESLKAQVTDLAKPLEKTAFFAQSTTLKSDVIASLDKIISLQESAITPEQKIRAFREASIEKKAVLSKIDSLKSLVAQASSTGSIFGFIGGAQAVGVWGIIIVIAAGFTILAIYMKNLNTNSKTKKNKEKEVSQKSSGINFPFKFALPVVLISCILTAFIVSYVFQGRMRVLGAKVEALESQTNTSVEQVMD